MLQCGARRVRGQRAAARRPVAGDKLGHAVQHRAARAQTQGGQHREPGQHAKHMAVSGDHAVLDHMANDFAAREFAHFHLLPFGQSHAGALGVTLFQRVANAGEVIAELPETEREIQHRHIPQQGHGPADPMHQRPMDAKRDGRGHEHGNGPGHPAMGGRSGVEISTDGQSPGARAGMDGVAARQRPRLLDQQCKQNGEKTHGCNHTGGVGLRSMGVPCVSSGF